MPANHKPRNTPTYTTGQHVAVYARISDDREGRRLGVQRQVKDCQARAVDDGIPPEQIREPYIDNDISASTGKRRPAYEQMLADIEAGLISTVVVYDLDRLTRRPVELEHLLDVVDRHKVRLLNVAGEIDLSSASGRGMARMKGVWARMEVERMGERIQRKMVELAENGQPLGGRWMFGYRWVSGQGKVIDPAEAKIVREIARRILAKESLHVIAGDLNARGVLTASGNSWGVRLLRKVLGNPRDAQEQALVELVRTQMAAGRSEGEIVRDLNQQQVPLTRPRLWSATTIRSVMQSPSIAGLITHNGTIVGAGAWKPILKRAQWEKLQRELVTPRRLTSAPGGVVRYLLSGLMRCEACGEPMVIKPGPRGERRYSCDEPGCLKISIDQAKLDAYVVGLVLGWLSDPRVRAALEYGPQDQSDRLQELGHEIERLEALREAEQAEYAERKAAGDDVERDLAVATIKQINGRLEDTRTELAAITRRTSLLEDMPAAPDLRWWAGLELGRRRALTQLVCGPMTVVPAKTRGRVFDVTRLEFRGPGHGGDLGPESPPCPT